MAHKDFIPKNDNDLRTWANNFIAQLQNNASTVGIDSNALNVISDSMQEMVAVIDDVQAKEDAYRSATRHKETVKEANITLARRYINSIKANINYTDAIGSLLGIISAAIPPPDLDAVKPLPRVKKTQQGVEVAYYKKGTDGVLVYCKRGNESDFTKIEKDTSSPFIDARPNLNGAVGENRQYYLLYFKNDNPIGVPSDIVSILV